MKKIFYLLITIILLGACSDMRENQDFEQAEVESQDIERAASVVDNVVEAFITANGDLKKTAELLNAYYHEGSNHIWVRYGEDWKIVGAVISTTVHDRFYLDLEAAETEESITANITVKKVFLPQNGVFYERTVSIER